LNSNRHIKNGESSRLEELDVLRGVAAFIVMCYHYTTQYGVDFGHVVEPAISVPFGRYGVHLFFVISGFVIFLTLSRSRSMWDFAANRFSRLYPPYWVCIGLTIAAMWLIPLPGLEITPVQALMNLTMLQYWLQAPEVDSVYWTLSVELAFYAFVSALHLLGWLSKVERWMTIWLFLIFVVRWADLQGMHISPLIRTAAMLDHGHFFFAGVLFYLMKTDGFTLLRWLLLLACIVAAWFVRDVPHALALGAASVFFLAFITGRLRWIVVAPLVFLGDISYPLYLLHQNIGYAIISRLEKAGLTSEAWLIIPVIVALSLAIGVNRLVEKPARETLRRLWMNSSLRKRLVQGGA
jgi:peptidoglycan/LPS O-acetylase OafA/YrhL